jgi:class 3 adenylate cyclase
MGFRMKDQVIAKNIKSSQKNVAVIFTDIEGSTKQWDKLGDVKGRLMIDQHNRLLFPVIKKFNGKIIKTIGDAIMAQFRNPKNALNASIAMQQALERERRENDSFDLKVRVGIHYGSAIVEKNDIFGDVVNVAARVEGEADGNEIVISQNAVDKINRKDFKLVKKTKFVPRGKSRSLQLYKCKWEKHESLIKNIRFQAILPVVRGQKIEIFVYSITCLIAFYFFYMKYIRYFVGDFETVALTILNPISMINRYSVIIVGIAAFIMLYMVFIFLKIRTIPIFTLRLVKGGFYYCLFFLILYTLTMFYKPGFVPDWNKTIYRSDHLFVEVLDSDAAIYSRPSIKARVLLKPMPGILLLLSDVSKRGRVKWNKVLVRKKVYGWIPRILPPRMGVPKKRVSKANKFYFKNSDLYLLLASLVGFLWGMALFSVRPS